MKLKKLLFACLMAILFLAQVSCQNHNMLLINKKKPPSAQHENQAVHIALKGATIQHRIREYLQTKHVNGSVAVLKQNKLIFNEGIGYANRKDHVPNEPATTYPIGSITKVFVATSIMQLQEKGELSIQDPISKYIPNFPNGKEIRLIHLLTHTSGIQKPFWHIGDTKPVDIVKEVEKRSIQFPAGTKWDYKDINYFLLGYILEKVTGTSLHDYLQKNIFAEAGMKDSGFITHQNPYPYTSKGYLKVGHHLIQTKKLNSYLLFGCGDIYATARDLTRFDQALYAGKIVSKDSLKEMLIPGSTSKYGLGLYNYGNRVFSRGVLNGWEALHVHYKNNTNIAILLNIHDKKIKIKEISKDIYTIVNAQNYPKKYS